MKYLTPWIVPNHKLKEFCSNPYWCDNYFIDSIIRHDEKNYCVVANGSYPFVHNELKKVLYEI